jgi:hypothetical protein
LPGIVNDSRLADVYNLLDDVQFAQPIVSLIEFGQPIYLDAMLHMHVLHVSEPVVDQAQPVVSQSGQNSAAAVVAADDHVLDAQYIHGVLQDRETIQVGMNDDVGDIAMDEHFARQHAHDLIRRHPTVGAADPEMRRNLLSAQALEKLRVAPRHLGRPLPVAIEQVRQIVHAVRALSLAGRASDGCTSTVAGASG